MDFEDALRALPAVVFLLAVLSLRVYPFVIRTKELRRAFEALAARIGGEVQIKGLFPRPRIDTTFKGFPLSVYVEERGRYGTLYACFRMAVGGPEGLELTIRTGQNNAFQLGDYAFDSQFHVTTNREWIVRQVLDPEVRLAVIRSDLNSNLSLRLKDGRLSFEARTNVAEPRQAAGFEQMIGVAAGIGGRLNRNPTEIPRVAQSYVPSDEKWPANDEYLSRLTSELFGGTVSKSDGLLRYDSSYKKRRIAISYSHKTRPPELQIEFHVIQKFWLRIVPQSGEEYQGEVSLGDPVLDYKFRIHTDQPEAAQPFLKTPDVVAAFTIAFPFDRFEIYRGVAKLRIGSPNDLGFRKSDLEKTLSLFSALLDAYEQQKLNMIAKIAASEYPICPFCRDALGPAGVVMCSSCRTVHHSSCWTENGECTTWGCYSRSIQMPAGGHGVK